MNKKIILLLILLFTLSGCTINYNLTIDENTVAEDTIITFPKEQYSERDITPYSSASIPITQETDQTTYYKTQVTQDNNNYYLSYSHTYPINDFSKSYFATRCYSNIKLDNSGDIIELSTDNAFSCIYLQDSNATADSAQINITTKLKVLKNNADKVNGDTYTWYIDKNNYQNKPINMTMQKTADIKTVAKDIEKNIKKNSASKDLFIIYGGCALLILLVILLITIKLKKNNKI